MLISGYSRFGNIWIGSAAIPASPSTNNSTAAASNAAGLSDDTRINDIQAPKRYSYDFPVCTMH
jgi:hypothetical protein